MELEDEDEQDIDSQIAELELTLARPVQWPDIDKALELANALLRQWLATDCMTPINVDPVIDLFNECLAIDPELPEVHLEYGYLLDNICGESEASYPHFMRAYEAGDVVAGAMAARALAQLGKIEQLATLLLELRPKIEASTDEDAVVTLREIDEGMWAD